MDIPVSIPHWWLSRRNSSPSPSPSPTPTPTFSTRVIFRHKVPPWWIARAPPTSSVVHH